jgi:VWFA-related protein
MTVGLKPVKLMALLLVLGAWARVPAQDAEYQFHARSELVLVNVTVRDKGGHFVRDLKPEDFKLSEDGKPQKIVSFDIENTDALPSAVIPQAEGVVLETKAAAASDASNAASREFKDRRLIILFFDLSAMEPDEMERAATAAENYVDQQMAPADLVSVVLLGSSLEVNQDFTSDRALLKKVLATVNPGSGEGFEQGSTGTTEGTPDTAGSFTPDDTEYNIFNTDRRLDAIRSIAEDLAHIEQKKSLVYFSSGMTRTGIENQSQLRAATNAAVRANLAIYTMDIRGLQAMVPGGDAQSASLRGVAAYSGQATLNALNENFSSQETLVTLARETGGRAFLDSNDFSKVFKGVQEDTSIYYVIGYHSTNPVRDGRYRRISVSLDRSGLKIEHRRGYYAPADYQHSTKEDRERQLDEELASDLPATDLHLYLGAGYFRTGNGRFYVPVSLVVPGAEIPFTSSSDRDKATLDLIGIVLDKEKRPVASMRETVKLAIESSAQVRRKNVQYDTGFILPSGTYHLKFVVRENQTGRMGSFETDLAIPDLKAQPLRMSSVILASQIQPAGKHQDANNPMIRDGSRVVPNVTHVFSSGQHLYLYYEVYDAAAEAAHRASKGDGDSIRVLTNVAFFQGNVKTYESPLVEAKELNARQRKAVVFQLDVPLAQLKPGFYTCQVNVIDDAAGRFLFPRIALLLRPRSTSASLGSNPAAPATETAQ